MENSLILIETIMVIGAIILTKSFNKYESVIFIAIPIAFLFTEKVMRHRSWAEMGFNAKDTLLNLRENWYWLLLVAVIIQLLSVFIPKYFCPEYINHAKSRLPITINTSAATLISIAIGTFLEEIIFRGVIQADLCRFINTPITIVFTSVLFAIIHFSKGSFSIVAIDLSGIFIDSLIYGIIFSNTNNILASWITHYISDIVGLLCLLFLA